MLSSLWEKLIAIVSSLFLSNTCVPSSGMLNGRGGGGHGE